jgi:diguanylate cyclase (GGDEF)-like protein
MVNVRRFGFSRVSGFTNEIETINRLKAEAITDSLTQLLNRNGLEQAAGTAWTFCKRDKKNVGVILADIDYFKNYNDTFGHMEGDNILKQIADCIKNCFKRETDIISRSGGDEFLILLSDIDDGHVLELAKALSSAVTNLKVKTATENNSFDFLSVSTGIATSIPQPDDLLIDLYKAADKALYHAKKAGRNCISFSERIIQAGTSIAESSPIESLPTSFVCMNNED